MEGLDLKKYAQLLIDYSIDLKEGERLFVKSSTLAEPLLKEIYKLVVDRGAIIELDIDVEEGLEYMIANGSEKQLSHLPTLRKKAMEEFECYLNIRAPFYLENRFDIPKQNRSLRNKKTKSILDDYYRRTSDGSMRRSLCQFPTQACADAAEMSLKEYAQFVSKACKLDQDDPKQAWLDLRATQQRIVDFLNRSDKVQYLSSKTDISFSVKDRIWINSDGRTNMPSGEVFTGPIEDSVNGHVYFDFPSVYRGKSVEGITLNVEGGEVKSWSAEEGQNLLDEVFEVPGSRFFGEVAIGTNYDIQRATKNILFDEKIGGTIHMAVGQSYAQTGGKNQSIIHWDMISSMNTDAQIIVDGKKIYEDGKFLI